MPSGYLDPRAKIEIIVSHSSVKDEMIHFYSLVLPSGDINKIIQNRYKKTELIIASQTGLFFVDITEDQMPEAIRMDPKAAKEWMPSIKLKVTEERYFEDMRVSQAIQLERYTLLVALWDQPGYFLLERQTKNIVSIQE